MRHFGIAIDLICGHIELVHADPPIGRNMNIQIRSGSADDLENLIALQSHSLKTILADTYTPEQLEALVNSQSSGRKAALETLFVAEVNGEIVGFSALSETSPYVTGLYVHPTWTRRGIGATLLRSLEAAAIQKRVRVLRVFTSPTIAAFYRSQGYQTHRISTGTRKRIESNMGVTCEFLEKRLLPSPIPWKWIAIASVLFFGLMGLQIYHDQRRPQPLMELERLDELER